MRFCCIELAALEQSESQVPVNLGMVRIKVQQRPVDLHCLTHITATMLFQCVVEQGRGIHGRHQRL